MHAHACLDDAAGRRQQLLNVTGNHVLVAADDHHRADQLQIPAMLVTLQNRSHDCVILASSKRTADRGGCGRSGSGTRDGMRGSSGGGPRCGVWEDEHVACVHTHISVDESVCLVLGGGVYQRVVDQAVVAGCDFISARVR